MTFFLLISAVIAAVQADVSHLSRGNSLDGYEYPRPAIPFESRPIESVVSNGYVYEKPKNPLVYPEKSVVEPQGYVYNKPQVEFPLPPPARTTVRSNPIYLPPTTPAPKCQPPKVGVYPNCQLPPCPPGYSGNYPNCNKPTTSAPLYIPPKPTGYEYPKPAIKFELPPSTTTPRPVPSTYLPPTQPPKCPQGFIGSYPNCQLPACPPGYSGSYPNCVKPTTSAPLYIPPKQTGYEYPKPVIKLELPPSTTTPRPVPSTYLPPTQLPKCPQGFIGSYPNCRLPECPAGFIGSYPNCFRPTTSAPYIPPRTQKPQGYFYPVPQKKFTIPPKAFTTQKSFPKTYLPPITPAVGVYPNCQLPPCPPGYSGIYPNCNRPTTSAPLYIPPKQTGYEYPKPVIKLELPPSTTTPRPVPSTYLPPTQPPKCQPPKVGVYPNCQLPACPPGYSGIYPNCNKPTTSAPLYIPPKPTGYEYPKPAIKFELPPSTTTPRPVPSTYLPPTQPPKCPQGFIGSYPNCQLPACPPGYSGSYPNCVKPTTSAPLYIPPRTTGYEYPKPAIKFTLPPSTTTPPRPVPTSPAVYLPPISTTTTTPAPTYLPPKYVTPKGDGYHYPRPAIPFDF
ncbi:proline-rich extensin-like protein EPR1 [Contarinia nasturtii]|uniref:proline-rich extensin-like protein EPR1 n=1 Tax=Contarinia nasturtii TaxID=265458 RepID=UPI0012D3A03C|nr:proline-rich extensin-like protein EPR1 [Contarinia nasturtii]